MADLYEKINALKDAGKRYKEIKEELGCSDYDITRARTGTGKKSGPRKKRKYTRMLTAPVSLKVESSKLKAIVFQGNVDDVLSALKGME